MSDQHRPFDALIGRLDRILSELVNEAKSGNLDIHDTKTLEHHAEDMAGAGLRILELLGSKIPAFICERVGAQHSSDVKKESQSPCGAPVYYCSNCHQVLPSFKGESPAEKDARENEELRLSISKQS